MNKILFSLLVIAIALTACSAGETKLTELREFTESLMGEYPNFESNDIAKKLMEDAIKTKAATLIDQSVKTPIQYPN